MPHPEVTYNQIYKTPSQKSLLFKDLLDIFNKMISGHSNHILFE